MAEASPLEFHGYIRGSIGLSNNAGSNSKWKVNRVGHLDDLYGEFSLKKELYSDDEVSFVVDSRFNAGLLGRSRFKRIR